MTRSHLLIALFASACTTVNPSGEPTQTKSTVSCEPSVPMFYNDGGDTCLDTADTDGDGLRNCDDADADGDGIRNVWDALSLDASSTAGPAAGFGLDGVLSLASGETLGLGYTTELIKSLMSGATQIKVSDPDQLRMNGESLVGAELLILVQQGADAGYHELVYVSEERSDGSLVIEPAIAEDIDASQVVRVQRVPHFRSVSLASGARLGPVDWADGGSGVLMFRALETITVAEGAQIDATGAGFLGGAAASGENLQAGSGESYQSLQSAVSALSGSNNFGGGGAGPEDPDEAVCGAGGGYGTTGADGLGWNDEDALRALGGQIYGDTSLSGWNHGSGGGAGSNDPDGVKGMSSSSGAGGEGGGVLVLFAYGGVVLDGGLYADGVMGGNASSKVDELGGGGGGAGGSLLLVTPSLSGAGELGAQGGDGGWNIVCGSTSGKCVQWNRGGAGGEGRVRMDVDTLGGEIDLPSSIHRPGHTRDWSWTVEQVGGHCTTDEDGDGVVDARCGGMDCDDSDPTAYPGALDLADDGVDSDCDGAEICTEEASGGVVRWAQGGPGL